MDRFATTHWTLVVDARGDPTPASREALSTLCQRYWPPLYSYLRRCGHRAEDAEDLTQGFFVHLLEKHALDVADPARGRFRSFLLASLNNFVANEHERQRAQKRGGGHPVVSIDATSADDMARYDLSDPRTPEMIFDRRWALTLLDQVLRRLRAELERDGKHALFDQLKGCVIANNDAVSYREAALSLGLSEGACRVAAHRLRRRYRDLLHEEVAHTVSAPDEIEGELAYLFSAVSS